MIYAATWRNDYTWSDGPEEEMMFYDSEHGRLIYTWTEEGKRDFSPQELYPGATVITEGEMSERWIADGWHYPGEHDVYSPYICNCCDLLTLEPDSRSAGRNVPHGALFTIFYECKTCNREYARQIQELQHGVSNLWSFRPNGTGHFERCDEPDSIPDVNPYGLTEIHLVKTKVKDEVEKP